MKLNLNGIEIDLPNNASIEVSEDGKKVKVLHFNKSEQHNNIVEKIVEKIRVIQVPGPVEACKLQHYNPYYPDYNAYPNDISWTYTPTPTSTSIGSTTNVPNNGVIK